MDVSVFHTRIRIEAKEILGARESAIAFFGREKTVGNRFVTSYNAHKEIPVVLDKVLSRGLRTIAIELPEKLEECVLVAKELEAFLLTEHKLFVYIALYGGKKQAEEVFAHFAGRTAKINSLLLGMPPQEFVYAPKEFTFKKLEENFSGTPIKIPQAELHVQKVLEQKLVRSAFKEYMNLMKTKNTKEFRKLYATIPKSKAVASVLCAVGNETTRLILFDNNITKAFLGTTIFAEGCFFVKTSFLSQREEPAIFLGSKTKFF